MKEPANAGAEDKPFYRRIRSFVRREGRLTPGQQRALDDLFPRFGLPLPEPAAPLDLAEIFGRTAPVTLEIGFGDGESLAEQAANHPERDFIGTEVHRPGVGHLLREVEQRGLANVRVSDVDAVELLEHYLTPGSLDCVQVFFPDPWHKKRHHKRRLIQPTFVRHLATRVRPGGRLHLATDWSDYAEHMIAVMQECAVWFEPDGPVPAPGRPPDRPVTKFERRGERLGHQVADLLYRRTDTPA
ncbi:tRNA (guanosine(46)-N7)-methyltransferase TrmB [Thioalkalivibrio sp. ALJ1]|uniref:tRNA (guanosine(46)-N7)-methyltransferase TrmB n=1 Tax=Thioalkalivibrio sp. ALJ1 TaxID=1158144 RepID=UPI00056FE8E2|nr:tRNA (guanosine(46)-N7)-methyltransferase TrmB [Thioalkalivibrio sp. ALJ1]